jgi:hypothetical protein
MRMRGGTGSLTDATTRRSWVMVSDNFDSSPSFAVRMPSYASWVGDWKRVSLGFMRNTPVDRGVS